MFSVAVCLKSYRTCRWTQAEIDDPANNDRVTEFGIRLGDLKLPAKNYKDWSIDKINMAVSLLSEAIPQTSAARLIMQRASPDLNDAKVMLLALDEVYLANKLSNLLPYVVNLAELITCNKTEESALFKIDKMDKLRSDFHVIASNADPLPGETQIQTKSRVTEKSNNLFEYLAIVKMNYSTPSLVNEFFKKFLQDDLCE